MGIPVTIDGILSTLESYHQSQRAAANSGALLLPGWEQVILIAPSHLIARFRGAIAEASPPPIKQAKAAKKAKEE